LFLAIPRGAHWAEVGHLCDSANDPVTSKNGGLELEDLHEITAAQKGPLAAARSRRNHGCGGVILNRESRFSEKIILGMTGGVAWM
jgi:hypothetical protein